MQTFIQLLSQAYVVQAAATRYMTFVQIDGKSTRNRNNHIHDIVVESKSQLQRIKYELMEHGMLEEEIAELDDEAMELHAHIEKLKESKLPCLEPSRCT